MKTFIVFMSMIVAFAFSAQASEPIESLSSNDVETVNAVFAGIEKTVSTLAGELKVPAEKLWTILVQQQRIESISLIAVFSVVLIIALFVLFWSYEKANKNGGEVYDYAETAIPSAFLVAILIAMIIVFSVNFNEVITGFVNPEYGALKEILSAI